MRRMPVALLLIVFFSALCGSWALAGGQSAVPLRVQRRIANLYPRGMAFVPGRLPTGYQFMKWLHPVQGRWARYYGYEIALRLVNPPEPDAAVFEVLRRSCSWRAQGHFHINGHRIAWRRTYGDQGDTIIYTAAWRCMRTAKGQPFVILSDAGGTLHEEAYLVAYAEPAR